MTQSNEVRTYRLDGEITMLAPLSHIGESHGTDSYLAEQIVIGPDGEPVEVFVYSGNAFRGMMRDQGTKYLLDRLGGLAVPVETFHLLFSGGSLGSETHVDIEQARMYRRMLPLFSILGGGTGNQIIGGKLRVGQMYPVTEECERILPPRYRTGNLPSWRRWTMEQSYTRKDDSKDERLRGYLAGSLEQEIAALEGEIEEAKLALESGDTERLRSSVKPVKPAQSSRKKDQPQQMRYTVECLAPGSILYQRIELVDVTELELGAWVSCLAEWSKSPYLGGKSNVGLGLCEAKWEYTIPGVDEEWKPFAEIEDGKCLLGSPAEQAKKAYDEFLLSLYQTYIEGSETELKQLLGATA